MQSKIFAIAAGAVMALAGVSAEAMPAGTIAGASATPHITLAAEGCGRGFELGPAGGCRPIRRTREVVVVEPAPRVVVVPERRVVVPRERCGVQVGPIGVRTPC